MKMTEKNKYYTLNKWNENERYMYFFLFACNKKYSIRKSKRILKVVKKVIELDLFDKYEILLLLGNIANAKYLFFMHILAKEIYISNLEYFSSHTFLFPLWLKLKIQDRKCISHHAFRNNYWNSMLELPLEEAAENGD